MTARYSNEILHAFLASEEMDNAARYLQAGRRFAGLSDAALRKDWARAWRGCHDEGREELWPACLDTDAELTLRGLARPEQLLTPRTLKRISSRMRDDARRPGARQRLHEDIEHFLRQCTARRH